MNLRVLCELRARNEIEWAEKAEEAENVEEVELTFKNEFADLVYILK